MSTIWKYPLEVNGIQRVSMPRGAKILCVQPQFGAVCLWACVEEKNPIVQRTILIAGTGHPLPDGDATLEYLSTFQIDGGALVFHAFELIA